MSIPVLPLHVSYHGILAEAILSPEHINARTGVGVRTITGGAALKVDLRDSRIPTIRTRKMHPATAAAEVAWFLSGSRNISWLRGHTKIWDSFADSTSQVENAYGYRWRHYFGRDQLDLAINLLHKDPSSRHALVSTWDPASDGLGTSSKATPCPAFFQLTITKDHLHMILYMRSSDIAVGLPYDIMGFSLLANAIAHELDITPGTLTVFLANAHLYSTHVEIAGDLLNRQNFVNQYEDPRIPGFSVSNIVNNPNSYVYQVKELGKLAKQPTHSPKMEVVV